MIEVSRSIRDRPLQPIECDALKGKVFNYDVSNPPLSADFHHFGDERSASLAFPSRSKWQQMMLALSYSRLIADYRLKQIADSIRVGGTRFGKTIPDDVVRQILDCAANPCPTTRPAGVETVSFRDSTGKTVGCSIPRRGQLTSGFYGSGAESNHLLQYFHEHEAQIAKIGVAGAPPAQLSVESAWPLESARVACGDPISLHVGAFLLHPSPDDPPNDVDYHLSGQVAPYMPGRRDSGIAKSLNGSLTDGAHGMFISEIAHEMFGP